MPMSQYFLKYKSGGSKRKGTDKTNEDLPKLSIELNWPEQ